ncbi:putative uncharacterized leucine-rich repeat-containing protein C926.06c [[Candida] railenensis]|uniref:Uncharacterized leucine-rich repeat-containing protein C926.06c n=1 Tax=[Candida] railenensis TaxID=45579 RepID=A0A9P0QRQ2_9ASCO|nr:putative uncharacterized leucine-rich repeat-containing protein C926.06c [[Candida] railenensis]
MGAFTNDNSIEGEIFIQRLSTYIRRNEESLANGLLCFSKNRPISNANGKQIKPLRLSFTIHHLYYISERIESSTLGVDVGPLNIKLDNPNHEPTFISFMANNARSSRHFESDTKSISSINSMKSIVSSASMYWRSVGFSKDPKVINKDLKYMYSSFTKIPCLILSPKTKMNSISGYEEYPCDTSVPLNMFKNLQVLEIIDYEPNEIFGWHILSEQLRILIIKNSKISSLGEVIFNLVIDDESGRSSFSHYKQQQSSVNLNGILAGSSPNVANSGFTHSHRKTESSVFLENDSEDNVFKYPKRERASTYSSFTHPNSNSSTAPAVAAKDYHSLSDNKWAFLKQLTISEASITTIPAYIFKPLCNLVKLNLSNNLMESIPEGLSQLTNLKYLNLADNLLTSLEDLPTNLIHLSTLNLNNNKLVSLQGFNNLASLEKVDLRRNKLKEFSSLKPIVLQFIKNPDKFNNVYLVNNLLPKNFRIDLFNLFNGIKYKNNIKIDDSRPGYFESALLLDSESAFKAFEKFFGLQSAENTPKQHKTTASLLVSNDEISGLLLPLKGLDLDTHSITSSNTSIANINPNSPSAKNNSTNNGNNFKNTNATSNNNNTNNKSKTLSPLSTNQNLTNLHPSSENNKSLKQPGPLIQPIVQTASTESLSAPPFLHTSSSGLIKSPTLAQFDLDGSSATSNSAVPGVITPIQVTTRMST